MSVRQDPTFSDGEGTTGRYLVLFREDAASRAPSELRDAAGVRVATTAGSKGGTVSAKQREGAAGIVFDDLGVAVVDAEPDQFQALGTAAKGESAILAVEPERVV